MTTEAVVPVDQPPPALARRRARKGGTLGRYLIVRALLVIPTVFILVTMVFFFMRSIGDPITGCGVGLTVPAPMPPFTAAVDFAMAKKRIDGETEVLTLPRHDVN